ncbi:MAG: ATP phosphoribosyltransferase regulatory subunit, partial [Lachnospiraceae bacterium]|nr:ATP phosphoribosyltransferase regulatory subunit [Lachnospiraceae bacterium]
KMDKIGLDGVSEDLVNHGYDKASIDKYLALFDELQDKKDVAEGVSFLANTLGEFLGEEVVASMTEIAAAVNATKGAKFELVFDPTLVRGMSYYTGTIFEIAIPEFGGSCGGGGRYDEMIGKFTGQNVPACGFSIGFERIILLLMESGFEIPERPKRVAYLVEKKYPADKLVNVMEQAKAARENGQQVLVVRMNKNKKFQKEQLEAQGYEEFVEFFNN